MGERVSRGAAAAAVALLLTPPIAVGGGLAMAPLAAAAGLAGAPYRRGLALLRAGGPPLAFLGLFVLWTVASAAWSPAASRWEAALKLVGGVATGLGLVGGAVLAEARGRALVRATAAAGALMLCTLLCVEALFGMPFNRLGQPNPAFWLVEINPGHGASILMVLMWPALFGLRGRARLGVALVIVGLGAYVSMQFHNTTNLAAFVLAAIAALSAWRWPRPTLIGLGGVLALLVLLAPIIAPFIPGRDAFGDLLPFSWGERIEMWRSAAARVAQAPLFGHGLDAARVMKTPELISGQSYHFISLHPHNAGLHIWLETGAAGACLAAAALFAGGLAAGRAFKSRDAAAAAAGGAAAYAAHALLSLGVWQEWWIATAFLFAASAAAILEGSL